MNRLKNAYRLLVLIVLLGIIICGASPVTLSEVPVTLVINGQTISAQPAPMIVGNRVMVPLRVIAENLDARVNWQESTRTVSITTASLPDSPVHNVPAAPNESVITGQVLGFSQQDASLHSIKQAKTIYILTIRIDEVQDVPGMVNFLKASQNEVITAYSRDEIPADSYQQTITAHVTYFGDERGGIYWLSQPSFSD